jgi:DNA-binding Lrp family transcriptional regulator
MNNEKDLIKWEKSAKLDEKDMKILKILDKHARYSIAEISKKTGIQRDSVIYRIKKMEEKSVIRFYHAVLNPSALGYEIYADVNFVLHNLTPEKEEKLLDYLISHKNIVYVAKVT